MIIQSPFNKPRLGAQINRAHPLARGLVGYWIMNEGSGKRVGDISGSGNHGTATNFALSGNTSNWLGSQFGGCLNFDGTDDHVDCGNGVSMQFVDGNSFSMSCWVYPTSTATNHALMANAAAYNLYCPSTSGQIYVDFAKPNVANSGQTSSSTPISVNKWTHIIVTVKYNGSAGVIKFYINGELRGNAKTNWSANPTAANYSASMRIGSSLSDGGYYFPGFIDECRMYNRLLLPEEAMRLYMQPHADLLSTPVSRLFVSSGTAWTQSLSDTGTLADVIVKAPTLFKSDTASLADAIAKSLTLFKSDTASLADAIAKSFTLNKSDSTTLSDAAVKAVTISKSDTVTLADALIRSLTLLLSDTSVLIEGSAPNFVPTKAIGLNESDSVSLSDKLAQLLSLLLSEAVTLSDDVVKSIGLNEQDTLALSDLLSLAQGYILGLSDTATLTDDALKITAYLRQASDVITLADAFINSIGLGVNDTITLSDVTAKLISLYQSDSISLSDLITLLTFFGVLKRWTGSAWVRADLKVNIPPFENRSVYLWDGADWQPIDVTG
jgi:hypothetical protein